MHVNPTIEGAIESGGHRAGSKIGCLDKDGFLGRCEEL
jgi:hypothetical protein